METVAKEISVNEQSDRVLPLHIPTVPNVPPRTLAYPRYVQGQHQHRESTIVAYYEAVTCAIKLMYARFHESPNLTDMAASAALSPHHFNRIFRRITGITPGHFLCAIRMRAARRMLLITDQSVTDICFAVGYNSLGSFISRFTELVGLPPTQLREVAAQDMSAFLRQAEQNGHANGGAGAVQHEMRGEVIGAGDGVHFVGLFPTPIPQGNPIACTWFTKGSRFVLPRPLDKRIPSGRYYALAASFLHGEDPLDYLLPDPEQIKIGAAPYSILIDPDHAPDPQAECLSISLRRLRFTDPPLLLALPALLNP